MRSGPHAKGASTTVEMTKRTARNAKSGIERDRVLHLDEGDAPDRGDADEGEKWRAPGHRADSLRSVAMGVTDTLGRPVRDLRISVTDRCNFRCVYCMPKEVFGHDYRFLPRRELLTFEEIERVARVFVDLGVRKLRITGGEPLLRRDLESLIERLAALGDDLDVTLTTNAALLAQKARALADAGLTRITVSLDSLDDEVFRAMNDVDFPVARVLAGIDAAADAGLPVKVNVVVKRGLNESSILDIARRFRGTGHTVRFIEFMDVGATNGWRLDDVVPGRRDRLDDRRRVPARARGRRVSRRGRRALPLPRRRGRDRRHRVRDAAVLRRLHARADLRRRKALHLPLRRPRDTTSARSSARMRPTSSRTRSRAVWQRRSDRYSEIRTERDRGAAQGRDVVHRRLGSRLGAATATRLRGTAAARAASRRSPAG